MSLTVLAIILIVVGVLEIFGFTAALFMLRARLEDIRLANEKFSTTFLQYFESFTAVAKALDDKRARIMENSNKQITILEKQYEAIDGAYVIMSERYRVIGENYTKLLECWKNVEERYSDCYEQLKYQNERFDRIEKYLEEQHEKIPDDIQEIFGESLCIYNYNGICQNEDCSAIRCPTANPENCLSSRLIEVPRNE